MNGKKRDGKMRLAKIKLCLYRFIYSQIKHIKPTTQNMRSPGNGFLKNIAKELKLVLNEFFYTDSIKTLSTDRVTRIIDKKEKAGANPENQRSIFILFSFKEELLIM